MKSQDDEPEQDPFLCRCGQCKKFWSDHFNKNGSTMLQQPAHRRAAKSGCLFAAVRGKESHPAVLKIGDRVTAHDDKKGTVKYIGPLDDNDLPPDLYVGIHLDEQVGSVHNGVLYSKRYFHCPRGHGLMVKYGEAVRINPPEKKPPLHGNYMFPSYEEIKERRKARSLLDPEFDLGPMYRAKKGGKQPKVNLFDRDKDGKISKENRDYSSEAPRDLITRWSKEHFGGGKEGERKARTLYKLHAAYQQGVEYKKQEQRGELTSSDEESSDEESMDKSRSKLKQQSRAKRQDRHSLAAK